MQGVLYTIDKLGESLATAELEIARLRRENSVLREQVEAATGDEKPKPGEEV